MHGAVRLFPSLFAGSDREKIRSAAAASAGVRTRVRTHNGFGIPPGESGRVTLTADRRLLARFDGTAGQWRINQGGYHVVVARAPMTHTSRQTRSWPKHSRHLTFASYGSPEPAIALFVTRCFWLPRASVGGRLRSILVGGVVGLLATVLIPVPAHPGQAVAPTTGMNSRQHCSPSAAAAGATAALADETAAGRAHLCPTVHAERRIC